MTTTQLTDAACACAQALRSNGFDFFTGVADSLVASLIDELERSPGYIPAVREDQAVGLASGAYLAGRQPVVLMQNSGLGYCLNALTSLNLIYKIPLLLIVGWRGHDVYDAPEHLVMGAHCKQLLEEVGIQVSVPSAEELPDSIARAGRLMRQQQIPVAIFIRPKVLS